MKLNNTISTENNDLIDLSMHDLLEMLLSYPSDLTQCLVNCSNQGSCKFNTTTYTYACMCSSYFTGTLCQIDTRPCSNNPCLNNGICQSANETTSLGSRCECSRNYYGTYCENQVNLCQIRTCSYNGYCATNGTVVHCKCFVDYMGENCELETSFKRVIRYVQWSSLVILVCSVSTLVALIVGNDVLNWFGIGVRKSRKRFLN